MRFEFHLNFRKVRAASQEKVAMRGNDTLLLCLADVEYRELIRVEHVRNRFARYDTVEFQKAKTLTEHSCIFHKRTCRFSKKVSQPRLIIRVKS